MRTGRKFEEADKETQQRDAAMTEYFEKHPELQSSEEKVPNEILGKAQNGFEEYYHKKKLKAKPTP
jgi:hypothetical protein